MPQPLKDNDAKGFNDQASAATHNQHHNGGTISRSNFGDNVLRQQNNELD